MTLTKDQKLQRVMDDFNLFSKNFIHIIDNQNDKVKLKLNQAQVELNELMDNNKFVACAKARQGGISTYVLAKAIWRAVTNENENILIVSYRRDSANALFEKLKTMNEWLPREDYPEWFPEIKRENREELLFKNGSRIKSVSSGNKSIGRSETYSFIHISEYAFFQNQEMQLMSAEQALAKGHQSRLSIETTSNGMNHWYHLFHKAMKGDSKYKPYFIPFYHELYKKQFKAEYDEAEKWFYEYHKGERLKPKDLKEEEKQLYEQGANLKQLMWRRWKLQDLSLNDFKQEFPSNYRESFISTGLSVFDQSIVLERMNNTIPTLSADEVEPEMPDVMKKYVNKGLNVFYLPKAGKRYYMGCDVSAGGGGDYSAMAIYDEDGQQALTWQDNRTPVYRFAEIINEMGILYNDALVVVEANSYGTPLLERLRNEYQYMNLYKQRTFDQRGRKKMQLGFVTTSSSKSILISDYKENFERGLINVECPDTLGQMQIFVELDGKSGNKKGDKNHDDLVIANALVTQGMKSGQFYV
ncbi:terminase large subunit domain-containing protein [Salibacterium lacus]|uniref:Terminase large subunit domain-containing protein n=1 Tax=Salibacterium lacus TaxID=1898109 RepID=A0ABW5SVY2_9BACI